MKTKERLSRQDPASYVLILMSPSHSGCAHLCIQAFADDSSSQSFYEIAFPPRNLFVLPPSAAVK